MTDLRDARLRQALDQAPDAQLQPHRRTREAIRAAAHAAVQPAWRRWWTQAAAQPAAWTAALATVALATVITVLWEGREPPGARLDLPAPSATPPAPAQAPASAAAVPDATAPTPQVARDRVQPERTAPPVARPAPMATPAPKRETTQRAAKTPTPETRDRADAGGAAPAAPVAPPAPMALPAPAAPPAPPAPAAVPAPAPAAAPAPEAGTTARMAPTPPLATRQFARPAEQARAASGALPWTQVRIEADGKSVIVPRPQAGELPALVTSLLASTSDEADAAPASLRLELAQGDQALGVLEQVGERWRWTPLREAGQARWLRADPEVAARLRAEAQRLLRR